MLCFGGFLRSLSRMRFGLDDEGLKARWVSYWVVLKDELARQARYGNEPFRRN